jgi:NitT/TauT family transport system permease protein
LVDFAGGGRRLGGAPAIWLRLASLTVLLGVWEVAGRVAATRLFPPASHVILVMAQEATAGALLASLAITLARVGAAFTVSMALGVSIGLAMGQWRRLDQFLDSWVIALLNIPALVLIALIYIWFGLTEGAVVLAVALNKLPATIVILREGARTVDRSLMEMAASFRLGRWKTLRHVYLPQIYPYLIAGSRAGLSLIWKIVLVAEILGRSSGVGFEIELFFQQFDVARLLAYSLAFILVVQAVEWLALQPLERRLARGRAA